MTSLLAASGDDVFALPYIAFTIRQPIHGSDSECYYERVCAERRGKRETLSQIEKPEW